MRNQALLDFMIKLWNYCFNQPPSAKVIDHSYAGNQNSACASLQMVPEKTR
jgi:hypothetical protein